MKKVLIFDWDGTLVDSVPKIVDSMVQAAQSLHVSAPEPKDTKHIIGLELAIAIQQLFPDLSELLQEKMIEAYKREYLASDIPAPLFKGAKEQLEKWKNEGYTLAIATGKSRAGLNRHLGELKLDYLFSSSRCADETHSKPDPKMLFDICQQLKVHVDECVMIGDTIHDLGMAQNAGMDSIGVLCGVHSAKSLEEYGPKGIYDKVANIELTK